MILEISGALVQNAGRQLSNVKSGLDLQHTAELTDRIASASGRILQLQIDSDQSQKSTISPSEAARYTAAHGYFS